MIQKDPEVIRCTSKRVKRKHLHRTFGDDCVEKDKATVRMCFQNINGFGYTKKSVKSNSVKNLILTKDIDIMAMAETNINWGKLSRTDTLPQVCKEWFERAKTVIAYNQHEKRKFFKHQPGGTAVVSRGEYALRVKKMHYDEKRLGRWSSQVFQGKRNIITRVVSVYVPCLASDHGHKKVACQQQRALLAMGIKDNVISIFWNDFWSQIDKWLEAGEQLIIGGDWNCNVTNKKWLERFQKRNLVAAMSSRHGTDLPETHNNGTVLIDEIFYSSTLNATKVGYLEHGESLSDHRPIWIDFDKSSVIGGKAPLKPTFAARRLKTQDPRIVARYKKRLHEILQQHQVLQRSRALMNSISPTGMTNEQIKEYEALDKCKTLAMKIAEKECRKLKMGEIPWSPKLQRMRRRIEYLTLSLRRKCGRKVHAITLIRTSKKAELHVEHNTVKQIKDQLKDEYKVYRKLKDEGVEERTEYLSSLAEALEKAGKGKRANIVQRLKSEERKRSMFRKLAYINKKVQDLSTKSVTIQTEAGEKEITEKEELEKVIIDSNRDKYHQTEGTCPFMSDTLKEDFGEMGEGQKTEAVLKGEYLPSQYLTPQTRDYILLCKFPEEEFIVNPLNRSLSYFTKSWRKMKEKTSSRDIHFGHYKAATDDPVLMEIHYLSAEIPFRTGYSPLRWKSATNVMILKKQGNTNIDKLRTLVLFESDFNHNNKFLGRSMMHHMVDEGLIAQEQYSAPGKKCIDHVINRHLYFDNIRYKKCSAAMSAVDLKSCYDRVSHAPAMLAMRSYGIPKEPVLSMFKTIQHMKYYTFTAHGLSKQYFGGKEDGYSAAPNGLGQGSGCAPTAWTVVSSKMFEVMHKRGASTVITSPLTATEIDVCGFAYVDDTDLIAMSTGVNDSQDAKEKMQSTIAEWEAVSKVTGGALVPSKCWSWIIGFQWNQDKWEYESKTQEAIKIRDETGVLHSIQMLNANEAREMLGVSLAPDGNSKTQIQTLKEKMTALAENIRTGHVSRHEAWVNFTMIAMKSLEYMIPALTLSKDQYDEIMSPVLKQFLPKIGLNRNIPRDLLYAPSIVQGFDIKSPYFMQGINHVCDISEHLWKDDLTGRLLKCNLEQLRIEMGDNEPILSTSIDRYLPYLLTQSYVKHTWQFMSQEKITLNDGTATIPLLRANDCCIMQEFANNKAINKGSLATLNRCRLYLKVFTLSDIVTGDGKRIRDEAWHGRQYDTGRDSSQYPIWGRPGLQAWSMWRTALQSTFCSVRQKLLTTPLGNWEHIPSHWKWFSLKTASEDLLIRKTEKGYVQYKRFGRSALHKRYLRKYRPITITSTEHLLPTTIKLTHKYYVKDEPCQRNIINKSSDCKDNRTDWLYIDPYRTGSERKLATSIRNGTAIAVSDGSFSEDLGQGTASWVITTMDKKNLSTAGAIAPGPASCQSPYRSEMLGLLGILEELYYRCIEWNIRSGKCTIFCDGISALHIVQDVTINSISTRYKSCDLLSACAKLKSLIPIQLEFAHVKGHQDDDADVFSLNVPAQMNVLMDELAKNLLNTRTNEDIAKLPAHHFGFQLPEHNNIKRQQLRDELYSSIMSERGLQYWVNKERFSSTDIQDISWSAMLYAQKSFNKTRLRTLTKWYSEWLGTGKNMKRWRLRFNSNCALCGQEQEDTHHILHCPHDESKKTWDKLIREYDQKLVKFKTNYYLRKAIILDINAWRYNKQYPSLQYADDDLRKIILAQRSVGWRAFIEGLLVQPMITYQHNYLQHNYDNKKGSTWAAKVIRASWNLLLQIWDFRNEKTHERLNIETLQGSEVLDNVIEQEWSRGLSRLPALEFSQFFRIKKDKLFKKSTEWKKDWLLTVKLGRSLYDDEKTQQDEFDTNPALREWIGLPKSKSQREISSINITGDVSKDDNNATD